MRASRLVSIILLLQTRGRMTAQELADELEVSVRTIYRDAESLHEAGIPLYGDAGRDGGYQLLDGYRTRLTGLTSHEADAVFLAAVPKAAAELGLGTVMAAAQLKMKAAMAPELAARADRIQQRFLLDAPGWYSDGDSSEHLPAVAGAVWDQRKVEVLYRRWREPTDVTRVLDPYGIVLKSGKWYVVAGCDGRVNTYRVSQILKLLVLEEEFTRPADFSLPGFWRSQVSQFRTRLVQGDAVIRMSPLGVERVADLMPSDVVKAFQETGHDDPVREGWTRATVPIESLIHAETEFLKFGGEVEVLEPQALRSRLTETARALAALYAGVGGDPV
ncbi:helix-turn-helix transcriptional regulator [Catelliglobosispora koreensis]|uniref:helix-turn-helix transcriptional regulator n=1 Tax=Catelliglobosispora koreensis TaxID=129052 RepID=UPI0003797818|nr:YafY family protein [Catelliglobosispora koreensis]